MVEGMGVKEVRYLGLPLNEGVAVHLTLASVIEGNVELENKAPLLSFPSSVLPPFPISSLHLRASDC